jgi:hypothetical protein
MDVRTEVPDDIVHRMKTRWSDLPSGMLQALAIESYRAGVITEAEVQGMLNLPSRWDVDAVLREARAYIDPLQQISHGTEVVCLLQKSIISCPGFQFLSDYVQSFLQFVQVSLNNLPDFLKVDAEILVSEDITHGNDLGPGNLRVQGTNLRSQPRGRFAYDLKMMDYPGL